MDKKNLFVLMLVFIILTKLPFMVAQTEDEGGDDFDEEEFERELARIGAELEAGFNDTEIHYMELIEAELANLSRMDENATDAYIQELIEAEMKKTPNATLVTTTTTLVEVTTTLSGTRRTTTTISGMTTMPTSTSTVPVVCGGDPTICNVEFDSTGEGTFECCTKENNPACLNCLDYCKSVCDKRGEGVHSCFGDESTGFGCECSGNPPTCYQQTVTTSTTTPIEAEPKGNVLPTILIIVLLILLITGIVFFVRSI